MCSVAIRNAAPNLAFSVCAAAKRAGRSFITAATSACAVCNAASRAVNSAAPAASSAPRTCSDLAVGTLSLYSVTGDGGGAAAVATRTSPLDLAAFEGDSCAPVVAATAAIALLAGRLRLLVLEEEEDDDIYAFARAVGG